MDLPSGSSIKTEGLSIKYPDLKEYPDRRIVLLDSAGLETPVLINNDLGSFQMIIANKMLILKKKCLLYTQNKQVSSILLIILLNKS